MTITLVAPDWQAVWQPDLGRVLKGPRAPSLATDQLHSECRIGPPQLETDMLKDLRVVLQAIGRPQGYTKSVGKASKIFFIYVEEIQGLVS